MTEIETNGFKFDLTYHIFIIIHAEVPELEEV